MCQCFLVIGREVLTVMLCALVQKGGGTGGGGIYVDFHEEGSGDDNGYYDENIFNNGFESSGAGKSKPVYTTHAARGLYWQF